MAEEKTPLIYVLIPKVMADIGAVGKERRNEQQNYKFRGIEDLYNSVHPALVKHGVFCCPQLVEIESQERLNPQTGKMSIRVTVKVSHKFYAPDGSFVEVITPGEGIDTSDKSSNKAMSSAMKYALIELFSVPTQDIEDADRTTPEVLPRPNGPGESVALPPPPDDGPPDTAYNDSYVDPLKAKIAAHPAAQASELPPLPAKKKAAAKKAAAPEPVSVNSRITKPVKGKPLTEGQVSRLWSISSANGWTNAQAKAALKKVLGLDSSKDIVQGRGYNEFCALLEKGPEEAGYANVKSGNGQ